jgi:hypothetical protein
VSQLVSKRRSIVLGLLVLVSLVALLVVRHREAPPLGAGEVRVTASVVDRVEGSRWCATRTVHVGFRLHGSDRHGSTQVLTCAQDWDHDPHVDLVVRASDGTIVRPVRAPGSPFAVQVGIATAALLGVATIAFLAWRRRLLREIMR